MRRLRICEATPDLCEATLDLRKATLDLREAYLDLREAILDFREATLDPREPTRILQERSCTSLEWMSGRDEEKDRALEATQLIEERLRRAVQRACRSNLTIS